MSQDKLGAPEQPPPYNNPGSGFGTTNYGFDQTSSGSAGGYPMTNPTTNQGSYGYNPQPASNYVSNHSSNVVVAQVGPQTGPVYSIPPPDYTMQAILACLFCFWPTALVAIFRAQESRDCVARGDMVGAHAAANSARTLVRISILVGVLTFVGLAIFLGVYIGVVLNNTYYY